MLIRLTTPEAFDALIDYLERERNLTWPDFSFSGESFRDEFIRETKEAMAHSTVLLTVDWKYDAKQRQLICEADRILLEKITTDEKYLKDKKEGYKDDARTILNRYSTSRKA